MARVRTLLLRARFAFRMRAGRLPVLYHLVVANNFIRVRQSHVLVTRRTALVMDGFPSSGNSYAIAALRAAAADAGRPVPAVSHHMHCPRQVIQGVRRGLPVLLLAREPRTCIPSALTRWTSFSVPGTLDAYVGYYESLLPYADRFVIGVFPRVTTAFGAVTTDLNGRFGTDFPVLDDSDERRASLYNPESEGRAARREHAARVRAQLDDPSLAPLLARADSIYERYVTLAEAQMTPSD